MSEKKQRELERIRFRLEDLRAAAVDYARLLQQAGNNVEGMGLEPVLDNMGDTLEDFAKAIQP